MSNRTLPYGYCYKNGIIAIESKESKVLKRIFSAYLNGDSMLTIAEQLNREKSNTQAALSVGTKGGSSTSLITHGILAQRYIRRLSSKRLMRKYKRQSTVATPKRIRIRHKRYSG